MLKVVIYTTSKIQSHYKIEWSNYGSSLLNQEWTKMTNQHLLISQEQPIPSLEDTSMRWSDNKDLFPPIDHRILNYSILLYTVYVHTLQIHINDQSIRHKISLYITRSYSPINQKARLVQDGFKWNWMLEIPLAWETKIIRNSTHNTYPYERL